MTFEEFDNLQFDLFNDIKKIGKSKGVEYTDGKNRLVNFKEEAKEMDISPLKVAHILYNKHYRAICSYIRDGKEHSEEGIRGRFLDAINYLTLMYGLIVESKKNTPEYIWHQPDIIKYNTYQVWSQSDIGPVCNYCGCNINKGDEYICRDGLYQHRFHNDKTATQETYGQD